MISYHRHRGPNNQREKKSLADRFASGWLRADTDDYAQIGRGLTRHVCAPGIFRDGYRNEASWEFADWIGFDFDSGELTLGEATDNIFCDMQHIIGVTMSHQTGANPVDKFRVMIPLERRIDNLRLYRHQVVIGMKRWPVDEKCKDGARLFYPCREIVSINTEGYPWEVDENVPVTRHEEIQESRVKSKIIPPWALQYFRTVWAPLTKNDTCFRLGCAMGPLGYSAADIVALIVKSPTYAGTEPPLEEIARAVANGVKRGTTDLAKQFSVYGAEHGQAVDCGVLPESVWADGGRGAECAGQRGVDVPG